jgi:hypothetical protein
MAYRSHHCSDTLPCSVYLNVFLHTCLALSVLLPFILCAPCPFNAPFLFCVFQLLHIASFYTPESLSTAAISSLFCIFILIVHLLHPLFTMLLHALPMLSALLDHHYNSSASMAVKPMRPSSLGVMPRFLSLSRSRDSSSSLS